MERTKNGSVLNCAFAQRSATIRTSAIQRINLPCNIEQGHFVLANPNGEAARLWHV